MNPSYAETTISPVSFEKKQTAHANLSYPIIVHSHLRWDWVWQRPQQFLSRLAKRHRILFIEGPTLVDTDTMPCFSLKPVPEHPHITIMQTEFPATRFGDGEWVDQRRLRLLREALQQSPLAHKFDNPVQWFYDPMAVTPFAGELDEVAVVYDCMDELSKFKFAPPELIGRERELLACADVVFAGGRKMHESKQRYNGNCHFYGCGVDIEHFGKARHSQTPVPHDVAALEGPTLGYFGVVDERMDYELVAKLAAANPRWNIVMVGPVTKVEPEALPQAPNIHWLGGRSYEELPAYTKAFDVCLMPFALNEATEYINPTKALEYMATGTPIVSTPVPDVVSNFGKVVKLANSHDEFIELCHRVLMQPDQVAIERGLKMADNNTWDAIVVKLEKHIEEAIATKAADADDVDERMAVSAA